MLESILKAAAILDNASSPTDYRILFDGESFIELNNDLQPEKKKAIAVKLSKRTKRRIRGMARK